MVHRSKKDVYLFLDCFHLSYLFRICKILLCYIYEGGSESSVIDVITLLIDMIDCFIIPRLKGLHFSFIMMPNNARKK